MKDSVGFLDSGDRVHAIVMILVAVLAVAGWAIYFATDLFVKPDDPIWNVFENAFVFADLSLAAGLACSVHWMRARDARCVPAGIAAGGGLIFLLLIDTTFNLQNGYYVPVSPIVCLEVLINLICLSFGPITILRLWRRRHLYEPRSSSAITQEST
jgi:hypothetical protein